MTARGGKQEHATLKNQDEVKGTGVNTRRDDRRIVQSEDLRESPMMARLWDDLKASNDIGHFGRLVFCIVARHFLPEADLVHLLQRNIPAEDATALLVEVNARNYNPPRPSVIRKWQQRQQYKIIPAEHEHDLAWGNVYSELKLPNEIYSQVGEFYKEVAQGLPPIDGERKDGHNKKKKRVKKK